MFRLAIVDMSQELLNFNWARILEKRILFLKLVFSLAHRQMITNFNVRYPGKAGRAKEDVVYGVKYALI